MLNFFFKKLNGLEMITSRNVKHGLAWNVKQGMDESIHIQGNSINIQKLTSRWHLTF